MVKVWTQTRCTRYYHYTIDGKVHEDAKNCELCNGTLLVEEWKPLDELVAEIVNVRISER